MTEEEEEQQEHENKYKTERASSRSKKKDKNGRFFRIKSDQICAKRIRMDFSPIKNVNL